MPEPMIATRETIESIFDGAAEIYDRAGPSFFGRFGARLVELMDLSEGARVLDVGTGTGAVAVAAAKQVGPEGSVVGVDLSNEMLSQAYAAVSAAGLGNVQLGRMDAERLEFLGQTFDAVTCGFALFFVPSMKRAVDEMYRVTKPGGKVGLTMWTKSPPPFDPAWKIFADLVRKYGVEVRMPNKVAFAEQEIVSLVTQSGYQDVESRIEISDVVYPTAEDWWGFQMTMGSRAAILRMPEEKRNQFKEEYLAQLRSLLRTDGLHLPAPAMYVTGKRV